MNFIFALLSVIGFSQNALAADYQAVASAAFRDPNGNAVHLSSSNTDKPTLLLFWANWCVPCKGELGDIANEPEAWKEFRLISVNIDEASERSSAEKTLSSLNWPYEAWSDEDGKVFTAVQESGELPLTLLFSKDGRFLERFTKTDASQIPVYQALLASGAEDEKAGHFRISDTVQFRSLKADHEPDPMLFANITAVGWDSKDVSLQMESYSIRQRRPFTGFQPWENEWGRTYARYREFTLGDQLAHIHQGLLLSLRALPGSDQNSSLLGLSYKTTGDRNSVHVFAGKVRDLLFAFQLDPSQDLTRSGPNEWVAGFEFGRRFSETFTSGASLLTYRRDEDTFLGFPSPKRDLRAGIPLRYRSEKFEANLAPTYYYDLERKESIASGEATWISHVNSHLSTELSFQESRQDFPRVYFSTLIDAPALPLSVDRKRSLSFGPKWTFSKSDLSLRAILESGFDQNQGDRQKTFFTSYQSTEGVWKSHLVLQHENLATTASKTSEYFFDLTARVSKLLTLALFVKEHSTHAHSGELQAGFDLLPWGEKLNLTTLQLVGSWAEQRGAYYYGYSGITDHRLRSIQIRTASRHVSFNVAYGKQSGGLQCTGGVCTQVPALDGVRASLEVKHIF